MVRPATTKLSTKGQVVIPEAIRERLGLEAGVQFVVVAEGDVVVLKVLKPPKMADFKALLDEAQRLVERDGFMVVRERPQGHLLQAGFAGPIQQALHKLAANPLPPERFTDYEAAFRVMGETFELASFGAGRRHDLAVHR